MTTSTCTSALLLLFSIAIAPNGKITAQPGTGYRFEAINETSLGLWEGDRPVFVYNHGLISSPEAPGAVARSTYLHPINGLDGEVLTDDFPADHDYHRGLYWAWPHITIDGLEGEVSLWTMNGIRQEFERWIERKAGERNAALSVENGWFAGDRKVMEETVRFVVHPATENARAIDIELTFTPTDRAVTLRGSEGKSYGGLNLRFGPRSQTIITSPAGVTAEGEAIPATRSTSPRQDLVMARIPWADFTADLGSAGALSGAALFVHPDHPGYPPEWMTRNYGLLSVGWPGVNPRTIQPGESFTLRYRLWIHAGAPDGDKVQRAYDAYLAETRSGKAASSSRNGK